MTECDFDGCKNQPTYPVEMVVKYPKERVGEEITFNYCAEHYEQTTGDKPM